MIASFKASVILVEERNLVSVACVGLTRAIPSNLAGRAKRSRSVIYTYNYIS